MTPQESSMDGGTLALPGSVMPEPRLLRYLQEANEKLLLASLQAHELAEKAEQARADAEEAAAALRETERELRANVQLREQLLGMVGHDLCNPLASIQLAAQQMKRHGNLVENDAHEVVRILRTVGRMERMIRQLLDFTRARLGGGFKMERTQADLGELCQQAAAELVLHSQDPIRCESHGDVTGTWDADRLMEVLSNIIGNAISYATPGTSILVQVRDGGAAVVAEISNQGEPISAEQVPHIFDAFRQARQDHRIVIGGANLGLGLYIAHQIVLAHGGTLEARSADGTTIFTIRLPRLPLSVLP